MKNSNQSEKSKGVVLFAFNTTAVDYVQIADQAARLVHHTLNLPVTLVTDYNAITAHIDHTVVVENTLQNVRKGYANLTPWRNGDRYQAYALSPYDETILLDSDYLMLDQSLLTLLETCTDYQIMHTNRYLTKPCQQLIDTTSIDQVWATAVIFKRSDKSQQLFDLVGRIQRNYDYYRKLYNIRASNFRNDFAFAIANNIINGYTNDNMIPWSMLTAENPITSIERMNNLLVVREAERVHVIPQQNLHIIDKDYLTSPKFEQFVASLCQE
jgi:hypothetical protein